MAVWLTRANVLVVAVLRSRFGTVAPPFGRSGRPEDLFYHTVNLALISSAPRSFGARATPRLASVAGSRSLWREQCLVERLRARVNRG